MSETTFFEVTMTLLVAVGVALFIYIIWGHNSAIIAECVHNGGTHLDISAWLDRCAEVGE